MKIKTFVGKDIFLFHSQIDKSGAVLSMCDAVNESVNAFIKDKKVISQSSNLFYDDNINRMYTFQVTIIYE